MKIEDLHYFICVGETGSITKAAQKHFMTQQGLSRIISNMERELCAKLLVRNNNRIRLTPAGEQVMAGAREIETAYWKMMASLSRVNQMESGESETDFTLYSTPIMIATVIPNVLEALNRAFPHVHFALQELNVQDIAESVQFDEASMALISWPAFRSEMNARLKRENLRFESIYKERIALGLSREHPMAGRKLITIQEMATLPFATYFNERDSLQRLLGDQVSPNIMLHSTDIGLCHKMVEKGTAVALWSDLVNYYAQKDSIVQVPIERSVEISYGCLWSEDHTLSPVAREVIVQAKQEFWRVEHHGEGGN